MPLQPRFRGTAKPKRRFVDREWLLAAFDEELERCGDGPRVLNVTGVGGIGKSRLLRELRERAPEQFRTATLDLQVPAMRQQEDALAVLRRELAGQGVRFDRFDIAYAVLWQRLHPHLPLNRANLPFAEESEVLTHILDNAAGVPVFGSAVGLLRIAGRAVSSSRRRRLIRADEALRQLDELPNADLVDAVTYMFAEDLRAASTDQQYVIFVDAYEALIPAPVRAGRSASADVWLRDLVTQLDLGIVMLASREPLGWEAYDQEWSRVVRPCPVDGLPMRARLDLLAESDIVASAELNAVARASAGVPFYLLLAVDTWQQPSAGRSAAPVDSLVSSEEIVQRFLRHVGPEEVRLLELLSVVRTFDFEIFQELAGAFDLPQHRLAWETLTAYSFVYPAGQQGLRLHQLMASALSSRLSPAVARDVHALLRRIWHDRASRQDATGAESANEPGTPRTPALREAVYHGLHSGGMTGREVLDHADRAVTHGDQRVAAGMLRDLQDYLAQADDDEASELAATSRCLAAEAAVLLGDAARANALTRDGQWSLADETGARLAVAAAHARRIAGETAAALRLYTSVWHHHDGPPRLVAGLWAADLHMCQGRFGDARAMAAEIRATCPPHNAELRGDVARLMHLAHRFACDFDASQRWLEEALRHYEAAGSFMGRANLQTNRAELLALTDPEAATVEATRAIELQHDLGAQHELGKAYTALAVAQLTLDRLDAAEVSLRSATDALEKAKYRSGRARAELYRAVLAFRRNDLLAAAAAARWVIEELETTEVYPTLVLTAGSVLARAGSGDEGTAAATRRARAAIQPFTSLEALKDAIAATVVTLLGERS